MSEVIVERKPEPILTEEIGRFTQFPIKYPELQKMYDVAESLFWTANEINFVADNDDWKQLDAAHREFIEKILAFFAGADGIVLENLIRNFCYEVKVSEARNFYAFQSAIENIHGITYSLLIETLVNNEERKKHLFNALDEEPCVKAKADWALRWLDPSIPFEERLFAFAVVEGVFFSGAFCAIFYLKSRGLMTAALGKSNELIARDEGLHTDFAVLLHAHLNNKCTESAARAIITDAVKIEQDFMSSAVPCAMIGMNATLMCRYIEYVADRLMVQFGFKKIYGVSNPFEFMTRMNIDGKTNFFEQKVSEYKKSAFIPITFDDDF